jgi:hypothetical protein
LPRAALADVRAEEVAAVAEAPLAMEVSALLDLAAEDVPTLAALFDAALARVSDPQAFCPEIAFVAQMKHERMRDTQRKWVWLLRWAARVEVLLGDEPIRRVLAVAPPLSAAALPPAARALLPPALAGSKERQDATERSQANGAAPSSCALYEHDAAVDWVDSTDGLAAMEAELAKADVVGLDAEWGDTDIATLQVAVRGSVWVVDAGTPGFGSFLRRLFASPLRRLGFSFHSDAPRLRRVMGDPSPELQVEDIQVLAAAALETGRRTQPGLARVTEKLLDRTLDKRLQCSDWDARPLTADQLAYAAADARVLLDLQDALAAAA